LLNVSVIMDTMVPTGSEGHAAAARQRPLAEKCW
jgi:hypothetical protein